MPASDKDLEFLDGTWKLIEVTRTDQQTGAVVHHYGESPIGYIMYGKDGRMMVLIARRDRATPASIAAITDAQRADLFAGFMGYTGTYRFDGKVMEHHIELAWNAVWSNTVQIRDVRKEGNRLIYTSRPSPGPNDGRMGFGTLVWEKLSNQAVTM